MKSVMNVVQINTRFIPMVIDGADASPEILEGSTYATVADTATGVYTVTFVDGFLRAPVITATAVTATGDVLVATLRDVTTAAFVVELSTDGGTLTDGIVHLHILGFDSADQA
jgi:hypothetical protein